MSRYTPTRAGCTPNPVCRRRTNRSCTELHWRQQKPPRTAVVPPTPLGAQRPVHPCYEFGRQNQPSPSQGQYPREYLPGSSVHFSFILLGLTCKSCASLQLVLASKDADVATVAHAVTLLIMSISSTYMLPRPESAGFTSSTLRTIRYSHVAINR